MKPNKFVPRMYQSFVGCAFMAFFGVVFFVGSAIVFIVINAPLWLFMGGPFVVTPVGLWWLEDKLYRDTCKNFERLYNEDGTPR